MQKQPHILIVGGSYGGLSTLNSLIHLSRGEPQRKSPRAPPSISRALKVQPRYTVLDERDGFYHSVGAPLGQISPSFADEFWVKYDDFKKVTSAYQDVQFVQGTATELDMAAKVLKYSQPTSETQERELDYDYLVIATGIRRGWPVVPRVIQKSENLKEVEKLEQELSRYSKIVLVGGGAVGIEMSAELKLHFPQSDIILVHSRDTLLSNEPLTEEYKSIAYNLLTQAGVEIRLGQRVVDAQEVAGRKELTLSNGDIIQCDKVIYTAQQQGANTGFVAQDIVDAKGCIQTRETLQFPKPLPNACLHYAVGDAVAWTGIKRSGGAHVMGQFAATNIVNTLIAVEDGKDPCKAEFVPCPPFEPTMSLAIGEQAIGMRFGLRYGKEVKERAFGRGLGIDGTLERLELKPEKAIARQPIKGHPEHHAQVNGTLAAANM